jgi:hypothetical protein
MWFFADLFDPNRLTHPPIWGQRCPVTLETLRG